MNESHCFDFTEELGWLLSRLLEMTREVCRITCMQRIICVCHMDHFNHLKNKHNSEITLESAFFSICIEACKVNRKVKLRKIAYIGVHCPHTLFPSFPLIRQQASEQERYEESKICYLIVTIHHLSLLYFCYQSTNSAKLMRWIIKLK